MQWHCRLFAAHFPRNKDWVNKSQASFLSGGSAIAARNSRRTLLPAPASWLPDENRKEKKGSSSRFAAAALRQRNSPESPAESAIFMLEVSLRLSESLTSKTAEAACQGSPHIHHLLRSLLLQWFNGCSGIQEKIPLGWTETQSKTKVSCHHFHTLFCLVEAPMDARRVVKGGRWRMLVVVVVMGGTKKYAGIFTSQWKFWDVLRKFRIQNKKGWIVHLTLT